MDCRGEAEVAGQALGDLGPRLAGVVGAVHADVVLLVHALRVGRADELVHAEADVLVVGGPVAAQSLVARRPRRAAVLGLERADALHDREEVVRVVRVGDEAGDAEVPRRLVRGIVPALAAVLAGEGRQQRPGLAVVAALEDARRLDADEQAVARARERRDLRDLAAVARRRRRGLRSTSPTSRRGRRCARSWSRATRSRRPRRSRPWWGRRSRGRRAILRSTGRAASSRGGRRSRARRCPCGLRRSAVSSASVRSSAFAGLVESVAYRETSLEGDRAAAGNSSLPAAAVSSSQASAGERLAGLEQRLQAAEDVHPAAGDALGGLRRSPRAGRATTVSLVMPPSWGSISQVTRLSASAASSGS